jgi:hypothetical protein
MPERRALHCYLDPETHDILIRFADDNGVSLTGLVEAIAHDLQTEMKKKGGPVKARQEWVDVARKVDALRRRRR